MLEEYPVNDEVPQGSALVPAFFLFYINDLRNYYTLITGLMIILLSMLMIFFLTSTFNNFTHPMLITAYVQFHQEPRNEVGSLGPTERLVGFEYPK